MLLILIISAMFDNNNKFSINLIWISSFCYKVKWFNYFSEVLNKIFIKIDKNKKSLNISY